MYRCAHITLHSSLVPHVWLKWSFHFISLAQSHAMHGAPSTSSSTFSSVQALQRLFTSSISCADRRERGGDGCSDPEPRTGYEPNRNRRILPALKTIRLPKLRVMSNLCPTTSHCCLRLKILLKALLRLKKQTWTTNTFVLCWLHHGYYQSEKQVRNDRKFITLKEKAWFPVHLKVWTS